MNHFLKKIETVGSLITKIGAITGPLLLFVTFILGLFNLTKLEALENIVAFISKHWIEVSLTSLFLGLLYLTIQYIRLKKQITLVFKDNFKEPLNHNWDFRGDWKITSSHELFITNSDEGGMTKKGALWENYIFTFNTKIVNECIGVIIRAQEFDDYYMFQINKEKIRPHRRISHPEFETIIKDGRPFNTVKSINVGWQVLEDSAVPHNIILKDWFEVKFLIKGQSIDIFINNELVFTKEAFLQVSSGKVGFRNSNKEQALIKNVKVQLTS